MSDTAVDTRFELIARVGAYPAVEYGIDTFKRAYSFTKESNSIIKVSLQVAENVSTPILNKLETITRTPVVERRLHQLDDFGCARLDQVESVKPKTIEAAENLANKIHGTRVEALLFKTVDAVDVVVDTILPAKSSDPSKSSESTEVEESKEEKPKDEQGEQQNHKEENIIDHTSVVLHKIVSRTSKDSIKNIPYQTFKTADNIPQVHYCVELVSSAADVVKIGFQKGTKASTEQISHLYQSLSNLAISVASYRPTSADAKVAIEELARRIQQSREIVLKMAKDADNSETIKRIKEDTTRALREIKEVLSYQISEAEKSDNAAVRKTVIYLEEVVSTILNSFKRSSETPTNSEPSSPSSSSSSSNNNESSDDSASDNQ
eukprot:TRINITY_DN3842_c1_g1_i1.p1 TRINITY_DN3842_c1_g1~~TRINITY_DN3842_c1_g1_i1.p1  ORF type:complete len:378 (-),score=117.28 TRINITY_DN3842_c1_g1_i1:25-1158(-)